MLRMETMTSDSNLILRLIGTNQSELQQVTTNRIMTKQDSNSPKFTRNLAKFQELSGKQLQLLLEMYNVDMQLFGYNFDLKTMNASCAVKKPDGTFCC